MSSESDSDRYERGLAAYASQFGIDPGQVRQWFVDRAGDRFATEAIRCAACSPTSRYRQIMPARRCPSTS
jgi:hypothetical protein